MVATRYWNQCIEGISQHWINIAKKALASHMDLRIVETEMEDCVYTRIVACAFVS